MTMTRPTTEQITHEGKLLSLCLADTVDAKEFGAVGDGVADDTAALKAAFDYAIPLARPVVLQGTYRITGPLQTIFTRNSGELHIICNGNVRITVDPASTAFEYVLIFQHTALSNVSVTGGTLYIDCANKAAYAFWIYYLGTQDGGTVAFDIPTTIVNVKQNVASRDAAGISIFGPFTRVDLNDITVIGVERVGAGVCRGIQVGLFAGDVTIRRPYIKNVLHPLSDAKDADGIAVAGKIVGDVFLDSRLGRVVIESPTFVDCQGRSYKSQCSNDRIISPYVFRKDVVTIANGNDFDFQYGNGTLISPTFEYRLNGSTSPLGASYSPIVFQNRMQDIEMASSCTNAKVVSDVAFARFASLIYSNSAKSSTVTIDGLDIQPSSAIATAVITRAVAEISECERIATMPGNATVIVRNVRGPLDAKGVAYTGYTGGSIASKLAVEVTNVHSTLPFAVYGYSFGAISGTPIASIDSLTVRNNHNVHDVVFSYSGATSAFDFANLTVGSVFGVDIASGVTVANGPPWDVVTGAWALVEVMAAVGGNFGPKVIRVTVFAAAGNLRSKTYITENNAATWYEIGNCAPVTKTANFTLANTEDVVINNKSGSACVVTLPAASAHVGRSVLIKTVQAQAVDSASSNVVPLAGGAAGTAIVTGTAGKWAQLVSNGTNWVIMAAN